MVRALEYQHARNVSGLGRQVPGIVPGKDRSYGTAKRILFAAATSRGVGSGFPFTLSCCLGHAGHSVGSRDSEAAVSEGLAGTAPIVFRINGRFHSASDGDHKQGT
jgi:hypothetical protein